MKVVPLCLIFITILVSRSATAADRVALVIGNGAYEHASKLPNAGNDATAIESKLKSAGFKTMLCKDTDINTLISRLEEFYAVAKAAEIALVFYAGHGIEHDKINYLLPTDAKLTVVAGLEGDPLLAAKRALLKRETVPLDTILNDLNRTGARLKLIVLDCCRDDPKLASRAWTTRGGNAGTMANVREDNIPQGTMLVFSTAPGTTASDGTGSNSPFTSALLQSLKAGSSISQVFTETAKTVKGQEPFIRFDGSGKALAAFGDCNLLPGKADSQQTPSADRTLLKMSPTELSEMSKDSKLIEGLQIDIAYRGIFTWPQPQGKKHGLTTQSIVFSDNSSSAVVFGDEIEHNVYSLSDSVKFSISEPFGTQLSASMKWDTAKSGRYYTFIEQGQMVKLAEWKTDSWIRLDSVNISDLDSKKPALVYLWKIPFIPYIGKLPDTKPDPTKPKGQHVSAVFYYISPTNL